MSLSKKFVNFVAAVGFAGVFSTVPAEAQNIVEGSPQEDGGVCYQIPKMRIKTRGNGEQVLQPNGTDLFCFNATGGGDRVQDGSDVMYDDTAICVNPATGSGQRCTDLIYAPQ